MCTQLIEIKDDVFVQCRKCEACRKARHRYWTGRLMAEQATCRAQWFVTLTYGGGYDSGDAYVLKYDHVQRMFKRLRKAGYQFSYVAVGEYGGKLDRAHFHLLMNWKSDPPPVAAFDERIHWEYWSDRNKEPRGFVQVEYPKSVQAAASYVMSYLDKQKDGQLPIMKFSKVPPLGQEYMLEYARKRARAGVAIFHDGDRYTVEGNTASDGNLYWYHVGRNSPIFGRMLWAYLSEWALLRPDQKPPSTEDFDEYLSELLQDVGEVPCERVQQFLTRNYGYEVCKGVPKRHVYVPLNFRGFSVSIYGELFTLTFTKGNQIIWQNVLAKEDARLALETGKLPVPVPDWLLKSADLLHQRDWQDFASHLRTKRPAHNPPASSDGQQGRSPSQSPVVLSLERVVPTRGTNKQRQTETNSDQQRVSPDQATPVQRVVHGASYRGAAE